MKSNAIKVSPHQIAWHMAYHARGGASFFLVKSLSTRELLLFGGDQGPLLLEGGASAAQGERFANPAALFSALRPRLKVIYSAALRPLT